MMLFIWPPSVVPSTFPRWLTWLHFESWQKLLINSASVASILPAVCETQWPPSSSQPCCVTCSPWSSVGSECPSALPAHEYFGEMFSESGAMFVLQYS